MYPVVADEDGGEPASSAALEGSLSDRGLLLLSWRLLVRRSGAEAGLLKAECPKRVAAWISAAMAAAWSRCNSRCWWEDISERLLADSSSELLLLASSKVEDLPS